ncbi:hypothetical protein K7B10_00015 [Streptomyces flavotricini]|uniref:Uncharacterized protein n=1 Tax=Streptomyces flavotricini TaxID=66888 RepID=A0ABS8DWS3_9ACTN|nr:hypothetical protein [Streptomyces flavotricini]MCC0093228.1 hypothetical protein [Streptomyces flavotricini]
MAALAWRQITTLHPWGIEYVDPRFDRLLIRFEPDVVERRDAEATQALDLVKALAAGPQGRPDVGLADQRSAAASRPGPFPGCPASGDRMAQLPRTRRR